MSQSCTPGWLRAAPLPWSWLTLHACTWASDAAPHDTWGSGGRCWSESALAPLLGSKACRRASSAARIHAGFGRATALQRSEYVGRYLVAVCTMYHVKCGSSVARGMWSSRKKDMRVLQFWRADCMPRSSCQIVPRPRIVHATAARASVQLCQRRPAAITYSTA